MRQTRGAYLLYILAVILLLKGAIAVPDFSERDSHKIEILDMFTSSDNLRCKTSFPLMIELHNTGKHEEDVILELRTKDNSINEFAQLQNMKQDHMEVMTFTVAFPQQPKGDLEFELTATFNRRTTQFFKTFRFSCDDEKQPVTIIKNNLQPVLPQEQARVPPKYAISALTLTTIAIITLLCLLIILYIIKLYIEK